MSAWQRARVAPTGTHHVTSDGPLYPARFLEVLSFHEPGLAAARDATGAFHIGERGEPAYGARFMRTFGFYEGLAAVMSDEGSFHIREDGSPIYAARYGWCGNYQGGRCAVRDRGGQYLHLDDHGEPAYEERWKYAGDYRDRIAVAQGDDGRSIHIDPEGRLVHPHRFLDLDVFHKGFARARDDLGWMHVDRSGSPCYRRRFAMVEPFYNGQARVERFDGALEIIDERGQRLLELRPPHLVGSLAEGCPSILFLRHAERASIPPGDPYADVALTPAGRTAAEVLAARRSGAIAWTATSPFLRCQQTARALGVTLVNDTRLGRHGPWVEDDEIAGAQFAARGTEGVVRALVAGEALPGMRRAEQAVPLLLSAGLDRIRFGSGLCISHDTILMPAMAWLFGPDAASEWLAPLDGFAVHLRPSGPVARWRDRERPC